MIYDIIILISVVIFIGAIIYFRWIKKKPEGSCHCYKAKSCNLRLEDLKEVTLNNISNNKKSE